MVEKSDLRRVSEFADLPDDQLDWFLSQLQELNLKAITDLQTAVRKTIGWHTHVQLPEQLGL